MKSVWLLLTNTLSLGCRSDIGAVVSRNQRDGGESRLSFSRVPPHAPLHVKDTAPPGTVNLIGSGRDKAHEGRSHEGLCRGGHAADLSPGLEGSGSGGSVLGGGAVIAAEMEQVADLVVGREEALGLAG